ncbi:AT hook motif DNA-binding family protein [Tripterygium wilfordii]|uniref:AT-hook motif nuclear-localized protein n=1 Tax=Tripterygium wilfordii TaxID=458696 RepID=A0A7J7D2B9_TRIWF|nr:AT-hook motif nuclear-localized protein 14 [Tripterygium wilfordii]KAF5740497.1 AT hook motif DNA-binding family protein [Tripterygium wilfordii]
MEPSDNTFQYHHNPLSSTSYFSTTTTTATTNATAVAHSPTNGMLQPNQDISGAGQSHMLFPHSVPSAVASPLEPARRKRGRPRKYFTPEQALAAKKTASSSNSAASREKQREHAGGGAASSPSYPGSFKKSQNVSLGNSGQNFTPHVITVAAGEDVAQKIMLFMQQSQREVCILSASGSVSNASLCQPAASGGNVTYEGRFEIISLCGSYVRTELGGRTGGLSICLANADGQIVGGGVGGPLKAGGPVQVIVGTFVIDSKTDVSGSAKGDASSSQLPSQVLGPSITGGGFSPVVDSSGRNFPRGNDNHQSIQGPFMIQSGGLHGMLPFAPRSDRGAPQSPANGDYDQIPD